jgi:hypothetical protein
MQILCIGRMVVPKVDFLKLFIMLVGLSGFETAASSSQKNEWFLQP